jgi:predicted nucleotidyltransferase
MTASSTDVQERFAAALADLLEKARHDPYILAVVLCGSLANDRVWAKSDIDLMVICRDDRDAMGKKPRTALALVEHDVNIHAVLVTRAAFRKLIEGSVQSTFMHSLLAKSRLAYASDETIRELYDGISKLGARDLEIQLFRSASNALPTLYKAQKWYHVRQDYAYSYLWASYTIQSLAQIEVNLEGQIAGREVIQQALEINPEFFRAVYALPMDQKKTAKTVGRVLELIDGYLWKKRTTLFGLLLDYLAMAGAARSATEIKDHFSRNHQIEEALSACEYLADKDLIVKVSMPVRMTHKSRQTFEELAFLYDPEAQRR